MEAEEQPLRGTGMHVAGAKFRLALLNDLAQRCVKDVLIACVDGLTGLRGHRKVCPDTHVADLHRASDSG